MPQDDSMMIARRKNQYKQTVDERLPCYVIARMCLLPSCFDQFNKLPLLPCSHSKTIGNNYFVLILIKRNVFNGMTRRQ